MLFYEAIAYYSHGQTKNLITLLNEKKISHNVLNAKHHEKEAKIISEAGRLNAVTIATNMAGRGTDIQLGGNQNYLTNEELEKKRNLILEEKNQVKKNGWLFVIGTERDESRRIDNQLRGRSGRQGDPGKSIFYISLEDDLMRIFGSEKCKPTDLLLLIYKVLRNVETEM